MNAWILQAADAVDAPGAGGKARALARAEHAGLPVPRWFVIATAAFDASLTMEQRRRWGAADAASPLASHAEDFHVAAPVAAAIAAAVAELAPHGEPVAVRSSAIDEDGSDHSFAGQLESFLDVPPAHVSATVAAVWRSAFSERIVAYRRERGLTPRPSPPAVIVQRMLAPRAAGVAFGADPVSGRRHVAVVSAVAGLGSAVVSGDADADTWHVGRDGRILERRVVPKHRFDRADAGAPAPASFSDAARQTESPPALADADVARVAELARAAGRVFGRPQDIEWGIDGQLFLLQSRPITSLRGRADPDGRLALWDNSNIVESYSGVTTPLTFSFARDVYEHVYREFCRMMGVPARVLAAHEETFENMLGLIRGRMYYNLLNWYRVLAMLPGFQVNRRFMEQMMGVKEALPDVIAAEIVAGTGRSRTRDAAYLARTVAGLLVNHARLNQRVDAFYAGLDAALAPPVPPLDERRLDELIAHYRDLRHRLLLAWDAPLVNDFFAMIYYGLLRSLVMKWCGDAGGTLQNDLLGGSGGIVSAEPAVRIQRLAALAAEHPVFVQMLTQGDLDTIVRAMARHPEFAREYDEYLARFGERTINELKLESLTLHDDPVPLLRAVGALAQQARAATARNTAGAVSAAERLRVESRVRVEAALAAHPLRRAVFTWVLRRAQRRVRDRENLRLERTRLFGRVRRIFVAIGRRLHASEQLDAARDVFYLELDEVLAFAEGRATITDVRALAALRAREFAGFAQLPPPDDRFETRGSVYEGHDFRGPTPAASLTGEVMQGMGCSPGIVRGQVRVVLDPATVDLSRRSILVAQHTDPGWIMVFPSATGVLVERGSLLSHAAIVARELGLPAIVSLPGITRWLRDGDWVEMDGGAGTVRRIAAAAEADA